MYKRQAERVSKSRTAVTNSMRLLKLCDKVQQMVIDDMISTGHARALLGITDEEKQYTLAQKIFDEKISVRDTEKLVKKMQKQKNAPAKEVNPEKKKLDAVYQEAEEKMKTILGTKVIINQKDVYKRQKLSGSIVCAIMTKEEEIPVTTIFAASFTMSWIKLLINCTYRKLV